VSEQQQAVGRPGRYQRSVAGGVGALIVLVLVVLAFVFFRGAFRDNQAVEPDAVDYLAVVAPAQESGFDVVYPPSLPRGWTATSVDFAPGDRPAWGVGMLTDDGRFVGVRQEDADLAGLLEFYVDENAVEGDDVRVEGAIVPEWQEWSDDGGDHAFSATVGDYEVLVYGRASVDELLEVVRSLTDAPVTG
jgi:hypothetical protein